MAGCSAISGGDGGTPTVADEQVTVADAEPGATNVNQTLKITVNESTNGSELEEIGATYPRDNFSVDSASHSAVYLGVDTDGDGEVEETFNESHVSGVNSNEYSFDVTLDTDYTLESGDTVVLRYPEVDNPDEPGTYDVEIRLNGEQSTTGNVTIE